MDGVCGGEISKEGRRDRCLNLPLWCHLVPLPPIIVLTIFLLQVPIIIIPDNDPFITLNC